jgi:dipeptidyl aminopeptidase/acylaminoacyl peptidase
MVTPTEVARNQLSAETYARAERLLPHNFKNLAFGTRVQPKWLEGTEQFWYTNRTREGSEIVLVDAEAGTREVLSEPPESRPQMATGEAPSPDGKLVMLVRDHNLVVRDVASGTETALTQDGEPGYSYGTPPDVTRFRALLEPLGAALPPIGLWSPDARRFATHRIDQRALPFMYLVQPRPPGGGRPVLHSMRYAMPGEPEISTADFLVADVSAGTITPMKLDPVPVPYASPFFFKNVWWDAGGRFLYLLRSDRASTEVWLDRLDSDTGEVRTLAHERSDSYIDLHPLFGHAPNVKVIGDGAEVVWWSERDGWGHLYLLDGASGETIRQLTSGPWLVRELVHVDEDERCAYFTAAGREPGSDPYVRGFYRVGLDTGEIVPLTADALDHEVGVSPSGHYFLDTFSRWDTPPVTAVRNHAGRIVMEVERADIELLREAGWQPPERFTVKAAGGETDLYGLLFRPLDFDPGGSYPILDDIYPGPQHGRVLPAFLGIPTSAYEPSMAALGFAVVTIEGRGTPLRSKAFREYAYGRLEMAGGLEDHVAGIRELAERHPWLDVDRAGIYGHSGGGFASVRAMLAYPEFYKVAVAASGNHDNLYYHAQWGEKYHGPVEGDRYVAQANASLAGNLQGKLLLIHGDMDDNVTPHLTMRLVQALIKANKDFDLLIVPNAEHGMLESQAYWLRRRWDYFVEHLLGCEPPRGYRIEGIPIDLERIAEMFGG